ncbi:hypothetical protein SUGI_1028780 [Cryptomeria japonica]|nr:hypothetical protein SUGI_1028780 [Cryptomeria japonica]
MKLLPNNFFISIFENVEDKEAILQEGVWKIEEHPIFMKKWYANFDPKRMDLYDKEVWIRLYNLPIEYWLEDCLMKIGRLLGTITGIDKEIVENRPEKRLEKRWTLVQLRKEAPRVKMVNQDGGFVEQEPCRMKGIKLNVIEPNPQTPMAGTSKGMDKMATNEKLPEEKEPCMVEDVLEDNWDSDEEIG